MNLQPREFGRDPIDRRAYVHQEIKAVNKRKREIDHLITNPTTDHAGDVVEPGGVNLDGYLRNPVVLANHDYSIESVIGKAEALEVRDGGIYARTRFFDNELATTAFNMAAEGVGGWSIGFRPTKHEGIEDEKGRVRGFRFKEWILLEYSSVAIPMNPDVVNESIRRGILPREMVSRFVERYDEEDVGDADAHEAKSESPIDVSPVRDVVTETLRRLELKRAAQQIREVL